MNIKELQKQYTLKYYTKEQIGYRLPGDIKLDEFWPKLTEYRQGRGESLRFKDQQGHSFWFLLTPTLQQFLHQIDSKGKDSLYRIVQDEIKTELIEQALIEEALFSSVIEGAFSTLRRARELIVEGKKPKDHNDQMVVNNGKAMRYILEHRKQGCSLELMHSLQKIVTDKTPEKESDSGQFRDNLVYIKNAQGDTIYTAPPESEVEPSMQALVGWINHDAEQAFIHPVLRATIIHTYFVYVHPYFDGNGRTARALFYWYLLKHEYEFFRYFSISSIIQETRGQYYKALKNMEDYGADLTYVLLYMTESVVKAIQAVTQRIGERWRRDLLFSNIREKSILPNERQRKSLKQMSVTKEKIITIKKYQKSFNVVFETARRDLSTLEKYKILRKAKKGRQFVYTLNPEFLISKISDK
jgi:Fic family protein